MVCLASDGEHRVHVGVTSNLHNSLKNYKLISGIPALSQLALRLANKGIVSQSHPSPDELRYWNDGLIKQTIHINIDDELYESAQDLIDDGKFPSFSSAFASLIIKGLSDELAERQLALDDLECYRRCENGINRPNV